MNGKRVFVTGGAGVIGLELVPRLIAAGATVLVGDLKPRPRKFGPQVIYRQGDLNAMSDTELNEFAPDILIHLAATFERSTETPGFWEENFTHNVRLSHHVMTLARDCQSLRRVVFASSYLIYDQALYQFSAPPDVPTNLEEQTPIRPRNLTGMAKLSHEMELEFLSGFDTCQFSTVCVRIFRGYGRNSRDVISRWVRNLLADEPITVYRPEGCFDYIYAADSAEGLMRLAAAENATGIVNLGTGRSRRVADVVSILHKAFPNAKIQTADSDIPFEASQANNSRLRALVGWVPEYDLEQAIAEIIDFERDRLHAEPEYNTGNVLITSASRKIPLIRAMQDAARRISPSIKVFAGDLDPQAHAGYVADDFWAMPRSNKDNLQTLIDGCRERGITAVLPTRDGELLFWAEHADTFAASGIQIIISSPEAITRCLDKLLFAQFGQTAGLPTIAAAETPEAVGPGPYVVKERFGAGALGIGLNLPLQAALEHAQTIDSPIYQSFIAGPEISVDAWMDNQGKVVGLVLRRRDRVVSGESQVTTTFSDPTLEAEAKRCLEALDLRGPAVMQAIIIDGSLQIIECNPRFGGASTTGIAAGLDSLYWSLCSAFGYDITPVFNRRKSQVRQIRVPADVVLYDSDF